MVAELHLHLTTRADRSKVFVVLGRHTRKNQVDTPAVRQYVSVQRAAEILDCHPATVRRWLDAGVLTGRRFGRTWRVDAACLEVTGAE